MNYGWPHLVWSRLNHGCVSHESQANPFTCIQHPANETKDLGNELESKAIYPQLAGSFRIESVSPWTADTPSSSLSG